MSWQGQQGWRQAMPLHVDLLGSRATHGRWAERLAAGHALGKECEVREQHPVASHSPIYRARHALPATVLSAGTPPNLVAESSLDCLGACLQPLRPGGLVRQPDSQTGAPAGSVQQLLVFKRLKCSPILLKSSTSVFIIKLNSSAGLA